LSPSQCLLLLRRLLAIFLDILTAKLSDPPEVIVSVSRRSETSRRSRGTSRSEQWESTQTVDLNIVCSPESRCF
jgi:hypothetical protein